MSYIINVGFSSNLGLGYADLVSFVRFTGVAVGDVVDSLYGSSESLCKGDSKT